MCAPLCDAVLERDDSAQMLERLEHDNLFVVPLDHQRRVVPLPPPLQGDASGRASSDASRSSSPLSTGRAASWCEANGQPEVADRVLGGGRRHRRARPARHGVRVSVLPRRPRRPLSSAGSRCSTIRRCSSGTPRSRCSGSGSTRLRGRPDAAERWALAVETSQSDGPMPDGSPFEAWAATVRALLCRNGVEQMRADAELAVSSLPRGEPVAPGRHPPARGGGAALGRPRPRRKRSWMQAAEAAAAGGAVWAGVVARSELALLALERGDLAAAESELALPGASSTTRPRRTTS